MSSSHEGEYRDGGRIRTSSVDWILLAGYMVAAIWFLTWPPRPIMVALGFFLSGGCVLWSVRAFVGIGWGRIAFAIIALPILALVVYLLTVDAGLIALGLGLITILLGILFRRQIRRNLPRLLSSLALRDEG